MCKDGTVEKSPVTPGFHAVGSSPQWGPGKVSTCLHSLNDSAIGPTMRRENSTWGPPKALDRLCKLSWETKKKKKK